MSRATAFRSDAAIGAEPAADPKKAKPKSGHRESVVEALAVAFILALLVRGFVAEAFVIPTGSMAPTLMGRHKEITCPQCGYVYAVNASDEDEGPRGGRRFRDPGDHPWVVAGTCVNCRFQAKLSDLPTFNGDRILVMKFPYDTPFLPGSGGPNRWDVVVFRYPEEPEVSYIKRLVGLSGEVLRVYFGDVYVKPPGGDEFQIARKPRLHQESMQMMAYDDRHRPRALRDRPEWQRWTGPDGWTQETPGTFVVAGQAGKETALRYRHLVPDPEQWQAVLAGAPLPRAPRPTLITDFYSYNTNATANRPDAGPEAVFDKESAWMQPHWVGDLTVSATLKINAPGGLVRFELIEGGVANHCDIDLSSGVATLMHGDKALGQRVTAINGPGTYAVRFANVDDRLSVTVDGKAVFDDGLEYGKGFAPHPAPTAADLSPVAVIAQDASFAVSDLVLKRDIYYTQYPGRSDYGADWDQRFPRTAVELLDLLANPERFGDLGNLKWQDYPISPDHFLMLGDNSPRSKDSRGWSTSDHYNPETGSGWDPAERAYWEVPRPLLTGKAFYIYWPHGKPVGPDIHFSRDIRVPFVPYFQRMKWIR